ncbi:hypothetical protein EN749_29260 [Mesorhizobium sp. M7A.F.Ca.ET.027.02.1.1]|uniref:hypothetical protein n=1 Tax=Mesorhizobium sp. M7A.F.Ca.ET.027.02.1.1 TaxID=2496655 RepID=UPI000FD2C266|nr:hypothetical protein [Mesorhizobium sp. M7A.F.Ca.ET.027.02.1.1]RVD12033.1 hypothetical protein EN749_29260 [Mesorhizobium sp. M7A.F.Ca.ET.027.02.1.1]
MQRVYDVSAVDVRLGKSQTTKIIIVASGRVPSGGWTNPALSPWYYVDSPADGIQDIDFCAEEPSGLAIQVFVPIVKEITVECDVVNYWGSGRPLLGVRVHAQTNAVVAEIGNTDEKSGVVVFSDRPVPWPWGRLGDMAHKDPGGGPVVPWPIGKSAGDDNPYPLGRRGDDSPVPLPLGKAFGEVDTPAQIGELLGRPCRCYTKGDPLTFDLMAKRVNIELDEHRVIQRIWFG